MDFHNGLLAEAGEPAAGRWEPDRLAETLAEEDIDEVVVTTVDAEHDRCVVPALAAGCRVVTEKPMTVDAGRRTRISTRSARPATPPPSPSATASTPSTRRSATFYGREAGERHGLRRDYECAHGADRAADAPFALGLAADDTLRALYLDAERDNGYLRDRGVSGGPVAIEDDMAVLMRHAKGATSTPCGGYRVMFSGSAGRLELEVEDSRRQPPAARVGAASGALHGDTAAEHAGGARLTLRPLRRSPVEIPLVTAHEAHGGGGPRMLDALFGPLDPARPAGKAAAAHPTATGRDGAPALAVGLAAHRCFETERPVDVRKSVPGLWEGSAGPGDQVQAR